MRVTAVEARFTTVVACPQHVNAGSALAEPELALCLTAREDDVRELLYLLSQCRVGGLAHPRSAVASTAGHRNQDILLRPITFDENFAQLCEIYLELGGPVRKSGSIVVYDLANKTEVARWNFVNAWPTKWEGPALNAKGTDIAIDTLVLANEGITRA